ncbi:MAG: hypothetical protein KGL39_47875 [Patescibacteria group bacterium]|nr:hypothetical protein [Patescibacteria group bacterium]
MALLIANSTLQHWTFFYREVVANAPHPLLRQIAVGSGRQERLECAPDQKASIIAQLEKAGAHDAAEVHRKVSKFHGLLYRDEGLISEAEIHMGHENVKDMQNERSVEQTVNSALAADRAANPDRTQRRTTQTAIEVEEVLPPGQRPTGKETRFALAVDTKEGAKKLNRKAA